MKHILVTTDFSEGAQSAFKFVRDYISAVGKEQVRCSLLTVMEDLALGSAHFQFALAMLDGHGIREELKRQAEEALQTIVKEQFQGFSVNSLVVRATKPVHLEILDYARTHNVDLIVIATHGRTGVAHVVLGSVSEKLIRNSSVPVLVIPVKADVPSEA